MKDHVARNVRTRSTTTTTTTTTTIVGTKFILVLFLIFIVAVQNIVIVNVVAFTTVTTTQLERTSKQQPFIFVKTNQRKLSTTPSLTFGILSNNRDSSILSSSSSSSSSSNQQRQNKNSINNPSSTRKYTIRKKDQQPNNRKINENRYTVVDDSFNGIDDRSRSSSSRSSSSSSSTTSPVVVIDSKVNTQRRVDDSINCQHYYQDSTIACSGCMVMQGIGVPETIPIIQSATLFFNSPSIRRHILINNSKRTRNSNKNQQQQRRQVVDNNNDSDNNDESKFFQIIVPTSITGWRTQAKLVATAGSAIDTTTIGTTNTNSRWTRKNIGCNFGLYQRSSHTVIPITQCTVHDPLINQAIQYLQIATKNAGIVAFDQNDGSSITGKRLPMSSKTGNTGSSNSNGRKKYTSSVYNDENANGQRLRYVQIQVERYTQQVCLTLVFHSSELKQTQPALSRLVKELKLVAASAANVNSNNQGQQQQKQFWHSIWCHCNDSPGNNIFARSLSRWHRLTGPEFIREPIPIGPSISSSLSTTSSIDDDDDDDDNNNNTSNTGWLYYTPQSFRQGNLNGFDIIATTVATLVPSNSKVCELYAGGGILGLTSLAYHYYNSIHVSNSNTGSTSTSTSTTQKQPLLPLQWLRCSDENPSNPKCFYKSVDTLPYAMTGRRRSTRTTGSSSSGGSSNREGTNNLRKNGNNYNDDDVGTMTLGELARQQQNMDSRTSKGSNANDDVYDNNSNNDDKVTYMVASAVDAIRNGQALGADVLLVDPPRKGLDDDVLNELCKSINTKQPYVTSIEELEYYYYNNGLEYDSDNNNVNYCNNIHTLIYVSCGFDAFTYDCERLLINGGWKLISSTGYVLFPGTDHLETLAVFQR